MSWTPPIPPPVNCPRCVYLAGRENAAAARGDADEARKFNGIASMHRAETGCPERAA
ncbi:MULTISPECIES: hypothetical protein [unclassified Streptomyces]|uniref:hypothetical protein n=1 Tax=unclassified Streptomyces TaxID=2593676 RepID=UPI0036B902DE